MFHSSRTTLRELKKRYLNILKKCLLANLMAFSLFAIANTSFAEELEDIYEKRSYWFSLFCATADDDMHINANNFYGENLHTYEFKANVLRTSGNGQLLVTANQLTAISHSTLWSSSPIYSESTRSMTVKAKDMYILSHGDKGIFTNANHAQIFLDTSDFENGSVTVEAKAQPLQSQGLISIISDTININKFEEYDAPAAVRAVYGGTIILKGKNINITAPSVGISANSSSHADITVSNQLDVFGRVGLVWGSEIGGESSIKITGLDGAKINIHNGIILDNQMEKQIIHLKAQKGGEINILGDIILPERIETESEESLLYPSQMIIELDDASWNIGGQRSGTYLLSSNNGVVDLTKTTKESTVQIDELEGEGTTFKVSSEEVAQTTIGNNKSKKLTVAATGDLNDEVNDANKLATSLASVLTIQEGEKDLTLAAEEGKIARPMTAEVKDGLVQNVQVSGNGVTESVKDVMGLQVLSFRNQINDVQKRMGDLRLDENTKGTWVRAFGGDVKFGDMGLKNKYNTIQAGADFKKGHAYFGVMASLTEGDSKMNRGTGEDKTYGMGVYAGYMTDNGWYVDATAKQMHLQNKFKARYNTGEVSRGSYKTWGTSVSLEAGKRMQLPCGFFVEPQAEVMYGRVQGIDYTTSAGVKVEQEAFESLIGRGGISAGKTFKDKGSIYANVSILNDFAGKTKTSFTYHSQETKTREDMGGAWTEFAVGGTYKLNKNTALYGEFATSKGTDLTNPVQWSVGLRLSF